MLIQFILLTTIVHAQSLPCDQPTVPLTVIDTKGIPVLDLSREELTVTMGGKPAEVVRIERVDAMPRIVVAVDHGGSMNLASDVKGVALGWRLTERALQGIPLSQLVGIVFFDDKAEILKGPDWQPAKERFASASHQKPHGPAAVFDALETAAGLLQPPQPGDSMLIVSSGADSRSKDPEASLKRLRHDGVRFFVVGIFDPVAPTPEEVLGPVRLRDLADSSGGIMLEESEMPRKSGDLIPIFEQAIQHYYLLTLRATQQSKNHRLKVRINWKNKSHEPVHAYAPSEVWACDIPAKP